MEQHYTNSEMEMMYYGSKRDIIKKIEEGDDTYIRNCNVFCFYDRMLNSYMYRLVDLDESIERCKHLLELGFVPVCGIKDGKIIDQIRMQN